MTTFRIDNHIIGESSAIRQLRERIAKLAPSRVPVLIQGPTGAGKELVAESLHQLSGRPGTLVSVNVCAIAESMFEDAFFGHVRGAFSGAMRDSAGFLGEAHRGSLFLDEVGGLARSSQPKLLRAIEDGRYRSVGGRTDSCSDFRLIAAANEDLAALAEAGHFRFDLLQRLSASVIRVPPLDERPEDIPMLARAFLSRSPGATATHFSDDALCHLQKRSWRGNVRELKNLVECVLAVVPDGTIGTHDIESIVPRPDQPAVATTALVGRHELLALLGNSGWDVQKVASLLGVHRVTVWRWMRRFAITRPASVSRSSGVAHSAHVLR